MFIMAADLASGRITPDDLKRVKQEAQDNVQKKAQDAADAHKKALEDQIKADPKSAANIAPPKVDANALKRQLAAEVKL